ncbi:unnamed protein product [Kluyveromyces dobzhanskii CBS 2104]|uniref:WGS project CCBQ000000000 data, contig 00047 n=1 Tax=Kluyveromyces dobzhanskii CBS 2104 TaxID=1427455 RepID=A0A0A8L0L0_9SACH|nr:unnamed protein product [Kluyveromyces dobzhanskii CBS 2104]
MPRFYCLYCKSYLTHDTASVRKSHLLGKNHIRLVADYFKNKAANEQSNRGENKKKKKKKKKKSSKSSKILTTEPRDAPRSVIHCPTNRKKRMLRNTKDKDVLNDFNALDAIYKGSPGYERIFKPENRMDIGHLLKVSKQPQRGNIHHNSAPRPTFTEDTTLLPPPRTLAWSTTYSMKYHDPSLLQKSIKHTIRHLKN